jgi:hypothetical protein
VPTHGGQVRSYNDYANAKFHHYDIVRKDHDHYAVWLESAPDLRAAESRIEELTTLWPGGEFQVVDQQSHQVVARVDKPLMPADDHHG